MSQLESKHRRVTYRELCAEDNSIPIFSRAWWLDAICDDDWDVVLVFDQGLVIGAMPYMKRSRFGFKFLDMPPVTQYLGPWIRKKYKNRTKQFSFENKVMSELIDELPKFDSFNQNWHFSKTNCLPFLWGGFRASIGYTYRYNQIECEKLMWSKLSSNIRSDISKARSRHKLEVCEVDVDIFYNYYCKVFERQARDVPINKDKFEGIHNSCKTHASSRIFAAVDGQGRFHAGVYIVWDEDCAYYLWGASDPNLRNSGATSLCLWEAINHLRPLTNSFDFEGSMNPKIERFFRAFGATQTSYLKLSKKTSVFIKLRSFFQENKNE